MNADEKLLEAVSQLLTTYSIESVEDVNKLSLHLSSLGVVNIKDLPQS